MLYVANVLTEYFALPLGGLGPYFVYPMLYLTGIGVLALAAYIIYLLLVKGDYVRVVIGYVVAVIMGFIIAYSPCIN